MNPIVPDNNNHHGDHYNASGVVAGGVVALGAAGVVPGVGVAGPGGGNVLGISAVVPGVGSGADGTAALAIVAGSGSDDVADIPSAGAHNVAAGSGFYLGDVHSGAAPRGVHGGGDNVVLSVGGGASEQGDGIIQSVAEVDPVIPKCLAVPVPPPAIVPVLPALVLPAVGGGIIPGVAHVVQAAPVLPPVPPAAAGGIVETDPVFWLHQFLLLLVVEFFQVFPGVLLFKLPWFSLHILPLSLFLCMQMEMPLLCLGITLFKFLILICVTPPEIKRWYSSQLY